MEFKGVDAQEQSAAARERRLLNLAERCAYSKPTLFARSICNIISHFGPHQIALIDKEYGLLALPWKFSVFIAPAGLLILKVALPAVIVHRTTTVQNTEDPASLVFGALLLITLGLVGFSIVLPNYWFSAMAIRCISLVDQSLEHEGKAVARDKAAVLLYAKHNRDKRLRRVAVVCAFALFVDVINICLVLVLTVNLQRRDGNDLAQKVTDSASFWVLTQFEGYVETFAQAARLDDLSVSAPLQQSNDESTFYLPTTTTELLRGMGDRPVRLHGGGNNTTLSFEPTTALEQITEANKTVLRTARAWGWIAAIVGVTYIAQTSVYVTVGLGLLCLFVVAWQERAEFSYVHEAFVIHRKFPELLAMLEDHHHTAAREDSVHALR